MTTVLVPAIVQSVMSNISTLITESGAVKRGKFKLSDDRISDYYIDKYEFETNPKIIREIADTIATKLEDSEIDVIAGPALGAVPLVTAVSLQTDIPAAFIRMSQKYSGTQARIEGTIEKGQRVAIIEDVTTTGGTILETADVVTEVGGIPERLIVVVDRNEGASEHITDHGYELEHLVQIGDHIEIDATD